MSPAEYLNAVAWDATSRTWVRVEPIYADQPLSAYGDPLPCEECGTTRPCTHAWAKQVAAAQSAQSAQPAH